MNTPHFEIRIDDLRGPQIAALLAEHLHCMAEVSPPESRHALNLDGLRQPEITFWSVWQRDELVGCGALKELDAAHGEVKSMRTAAAHLRKGVASFVLKHIISEAKRRGYQWLSLETGAMPYFTPAHRLYRNFGFTSCPPFADYRHDPNSVFMSMELDPIVKAGEAMNPNKASLTEKFALIQEHWRPKVVAELNGQELKLAKFAGVFPWHHHDNEDELFLVWRGEMTIEFRDRRIVLKAGEFVVVPRGVEHRTMADIEAEVLIFEPAQTRNTGNVVDEKFTAPNRIGI